MFFECYILDVFIPPRLKIDTFDKTKYIHIYAEEGVELMPGGYGLNKLNLIRPTRKNYSIFALSY